MKAAALTMAAAVQVKRYPDNHFWCDCCVALQYATGAWLCIITNEISGADCHSGRADQIKHTPWRP